MCLIAFAWDSHPKYKLILVANRDEFYERPTAAADFWQDQPDIFGGRDLKADGTWMGFSKKSKFAALTNYRDLKNIRENARSRGDIITDYLNHKNSPETFLSSLHDYAGDYNGFNFLACDFKKMFHYSNYEGKYNDVPPGIHGLSNALLDTSWPKVDALKTAFARTISENFSHNQLLNLLTDANTFADEILPNTGVSPEWEKALSPICIRTEKYGTCSSAVITVDRLGMVNFTEKTHAVGGRKENTVNFEFEIEI
ncbi:MAG: hypothetical protein ACJA08_000334 [Cyclobacteriaceae bacterium]|jgi:uncharacterized protein with NRDE domain